MNLSLGNKFCYLSESPEDNFNNITSKIIQEKKIFPSPHKLPFSYSSIENNENLMLHENISENLYSPSSIEIEFGDTLFSVYTIT